MTLFWKEARMAVKVVTAGQAEGEDFEAGTVVLYLDEEQARDPVYVDALREMLAFRAARAQSRHENEVYGGTGAPRSPDAPPEGPACGAAGERGCASEAELRLEEAIGEVGADNGGDDSRDASPKDGLFEGFFQEAEVRACFEEPPSPPNMLVNVCGCNEVVFC